MTRLSRPGNTCLKFEISQDRADELRDACRDDGVKLSFLIRSLIDEYLGERKAEMLRRQSPDLRRRKNIGPAKSRAEST